MLQPAQIRSAYNFYKPKNDFTKYVLVCGSDDTGISYHLYGKRRFWRILAEAKRKIKAKRGEEIIKEILPDAIFSYTGFFDIASPDGDYNVFPFYEALYKEKLSKRPLFRYFKAVGKPALVVYGDKDEYAWGDVPKIVEMLRSYQPDFDYRIIEGANHRFQGHEKELATAIAEWL